MGLFKSIGKIFKSVAPIAGSIIGGPVGGAIGSAISGGIGAAEAAAAGKKNKKAVQAAADAQQAAYNRAIDLLNQRYQEASGYLTPSITAGNDALSGIRGLLGLNGSAEQGSSIDALKGSPLFESLFDTGRDSILGSASATGGLRGGNVNSALADFGRNTLAQVIQQQLQNLGGLQSQGQSAALGLSGIGTQNAGSLINQFTNIGDSQAGAILGQRAIANQTASTTDNILGSIFGGSSGGLGNVLGSLFGGSGGSSKGGGAASGASLFPSVFDKSANPYILSNIDTSPLIQKIGF